jgi:hypothetical protein
MPTPTLAQLLHEAAVNAAKEQRITADVKRRLEPLLTNATTQTESEKKWQKLKEDFGR